MIMAGKSARSFYEQREGVVTAPEHEVIVLGMDWYEPVRSRIGLRVGDVVGVRRMVLGAEPTTALEVVEKIGPRVLRAAGTSFGRRSGSATEPAAGEHVWLVDPVDPQVLAEAGPHLRDPGVSRAVVAQLLGRIDEAAGHEPQRVPLAAHEVDQDEVPDAQGVEPEDDEIETDETDEVEQ